MDYFCYMSIHFTLVITWIGKANTEIGLNPYNSVIKRLRYMSDRDSEANEQET